MHKNKIYYLNITDKNGKEVTSKSKLKFKDHLGSVFYSVDECRFKIKWEDGFIRSITNKFASECEVIE